MAFTQITTLLVYLFGTMFLCYAVVVSFLEKEKDAALKILFLFILFSVLTIPLFYLQNNFSETARYIYLGLIGGSAVLFIIPLRGGKKGPRNQIPHRIDERDIMFSRAKLVPDSERFTGYYQSHPEYFQPDQKFREAPGLLKSKSLYFNPHHFSAANASFSTVDAFHSIVDGNPAETVVTADAQKTTTFIKSWAKKLGAVSCGITELQAYHKYTHIGRGENYGKSVELNHKFAIAFTVKMDQAALSTAPLGPTVMESAQQYLNAGTIAIQIAEYIRGLGYPARAHIDANYQVVCPLVAKDAGLGEIGRMGLLMTPELGPRVRVGVVTTDIPLRLNPPTHDNTVLDFCSACKKCADACPSNAIPFKDQQSIDGITRWQINSEACYTFWCKIGTDCGRCVSACPYSHPDNFLHNMVRWGIKNNYLFRKLALPLDDYFYGRVPAPKKLPDWLNI